MYSNGKNQTYQAYHYDLTRNLGLLNSFTLDHICACKTTLGLQIQCNKSKYHIFTNVGPREKPLENFSFDLDVPKSIPLDADEKQRIWMSRTPKIFHPITQTMILTFQSVGLRKGESQALSFWRWKMIHAQLVSQLIRVQLVLLD